MIEVDKLTKYFGPVLAIDRVSFEISEGELVAVMAIDLGESNGVRIRDLIVAPELRRKRIGRVMMSEVESLAAKMERDWLIAEDAGISREFLRRVGFIDEGTRMVRRVAR